MLGKKHNDPLSWKHKLEALNGLPGEAGVAKNEMWDKLAYRLQSSRTDNKAIWYWIAAGLLPFIVMVFTMADDTGKLVAKKVGINKDDINTAILFLPPQSKESLSLSVTAPVVKNQPAVSNIRDKETIIIKDTTKESEIAVNSLTSEPKNITTTDNILHGDTALDIVVVTPVKKKLPVIHINELETLQFTSPVNYAENLTGTKPRRNKLNNQNTVTQNRIGFNIKLSSKN